MPVTRQPPSRALPGGGRTDNVGAMRPADPHGTGQTIRRLMEWAQRPEWSPLFEKVLSEHVAPVLEDYEIENLAELREVLGGALFGTGVYGPAFEDFMTRQNDEGETIVDEYVRRRGYRESVPGRRYIEGLRDSLMSLYEVLESMPGSHLVLRDRLRGGAEVRVDERSGSAQLVRWDRLAARIVPLNRQWVMSGAPLVFRSETADMIERTFRRSSIRARRVLRTIAERKPGPGEIDDDELRRIVAEAPVEATAGEDEAGAGAGPPAADDSSAEYLLRPLAPILTRLWLQQTLDQLRKPLPTMQNTDGEALVFVGTRWPIAEGAAPELERRLADEEEKWLFRYAPEKRRWAWQESRPDPVKPRGGARKRGKAINLDRLTVSGGDDPLDRLSLGSVYIDGAELVLETNSEQRAARGRERLERLLAGLLGPAASKRESFQEMWQRYQEDPPLAPQDPVGPPPEEQVRILGEMLDRHYRTWPDHPLPALDGKTPRAAARTATGRPKLARLLKQMEGQEQHRVRDEGGKPYDFGWIRRELGIGEDEG